MISLTRKTASGSHSMMKTSSVLTRDECLRRRSAWTELWIAIRGVSSGAVSPSLSGAAGRFRWNENGSGSADWEERDKERKAL